MFRYPQPYDDIIDSRDVIKAIDELESEAEDGELDEDDAELLVQLKALAEEGEGSPDWHYGETLIHDGYFEAYAQQLAEDIGAVSNDNSWPNYCIDWEQAARDLQMDYMSVEFGDQTYWIRA